MRKFFTMLLAFAMTLVTLVGCAYKPSELTGEKVPSQIPYYDGIGTEEYDSSIFYRNDLDYTPAADPCVIYVPEERDPVNGGWYYMYTTSQLSRVARSKDLVSWENVGKTVVLESGMAWPTSGGWAPEVIYDESIKKYCMFYMGIPQKGSGYIDDSRYNESGNATFCLGLMVSDYPVGPFTVWHGTTMPDENGVTHEIAFDQPTYDFWDKPVTNPKDGNVKDTVLTGLIDAHPYIDADTGKKYLFMAGSGELPVPDDGTRRGNCIYGVEMSADWSTPYYSTLTRITQPTKFVVDGEEDFELENSMQKCNEGPWMLKHDGRYYLTYSDAYYTNRTYKVNVAVSDKPLGPFTKLDESVNPICAIDASHDHMGGAGHHCFVTVGDEIWCVYHVHRDRATGAGNPRAIAIDKMEWIYNETLGYDVPYVNGPTWSLQPRPSAMTGYKNIASEATVEIVDGKGDGIENLTDGIFTTHQTTAEGLEFSFKDKITLKLTFSEARSVKSVMIYNSYYYEFAFGVIDYISFETTEKPAAFVGKYDGTVDIINLRFNENYYNAEEMVMRPGGSALAEFDEIKVKSITISVSRRLATDLDYEEIAISDIAVIGK